MLKQSLNPPRADRTPVGVRTPPLLRIGKMKRYFLALIALFLATLGSSPAFAAIYTYNLNSIPGSGTSWKGNATLKINTNEHTGNITLPGNMVIDFTAANLANFNGDFSSFTAQIDPSTVRYKFFHKRGGSSTYTAHRGQTFTLAFADGRMSITASDYSKGYSTKPGWTRTASVGTMVPAPDSVLLFGLGVLGLFGLRRYGARAKPVAKPSLGGLVPA